MPTNNKQEEADRLRQEEAERHKQAKADLFNKLNEGFQADMAASRAEAVKQPTAQQLAAAEKLAAQEPTVQQMAPEFRAAQSVATKPASSNGFVKSLLALIQTILSLLKPRASAPELGAKGATHSGGITNTEFAHSHESQAFDSKLHSEPSAVRGRSDSVDSGVGAEQRYRSLSDNPENRSPSPRADNTNDLDPGLH